MSHLPNQVPGCSARNNRILFVVLEPITLYVYGVRSLSSVLKSRGFDARILFYYPTNFCLDLSAALAEFLDLCSGFDVIAFSFMSTRFPLAVRLTEHVRRNFPDKIVVFGGHDAIVDPSRNLTVADAVCIGEGEIALADYMESLEKGITQPRVRGVSTRSGSEIYHAAPPELIRDFNLIPTVDNDFQRHYLTSGNKIFPVQGRIGNRYMFSNYMTMTSFGCSMRCAYCVNSKMMSIYPDWNKVRRRPVNHIIAELKNALIKLPVIRSVDFVDDDFGSANIEYLEEFRDIYVKEINLPLDIMGLRPTDVIDEKLQILKSMGATKVRMGIQSVTDNGKELFNRKYSNEYIMEKVNMLHGFRNDFHTIRYDFIINTPWDKPTDTMETLIFISEMPPPFSVNVFTLALYPGTALYKKAIDENLISEADVWEDRLNKNFMELKPTWENLLLICMGIVHLPPKVLNILIHPRLMQHLKNIPFPLFRLAFMLSMAKRFVIMVCSGDFAQFKKILLYLHEYSWLFRFRRTKERGRFTSESCLSDKAAGSE